MSISPRIKILIGRKNEQTLLGPFCVSEILQERHITFVKRAGVESESSPALALPADSRSFSKIKNWFSDNKKMSSNIVHLCVEKRPFKTNHCVCPPQHSIVTHFRKKWVAFINHLSCHLCSKGVQCQSEINLMLVIFVLYLQKKINFLI